MRAAALLFYVLLLAACTRRNGGPHLQLVTPSASTPNFGDAPSRSAESLQQGGGGGGGGGGVAEPGGGGGGGGRGSVVGPLLGGAVGVGATAGAVGAGLLTCKPGEDMPSDAGTTNLCVRPK